MDFIQGIDTSKHQGDVSFEKTQEAGMRFAFIKCTEGMGYTDPRFYESWGKLVALDGVYIRGAYHFARPDTGGGKKDGEREASYFAKVLHLGGYCDKGALPPALDFEKYSSFGARENIPWVEGFVDVMEKEFGRKPIIYTGRNIWKYEVGNTDRFIDCPLWQVNYSQRKTVPVKMPWDKWTFWQWSGGRGDTFDYCFWFKKHGKMPGVQNGICDVNRFNGTWEDLRKLALLPCSSIM